MQHLVQRRMRWALFVVPLLFCLNEWLTIAPAYAENDLKFYLITDKANEDNKSLKIRTLRAIYSMQTQRWPNGEQLTVFALPDEERLHEFFCREVLGILPYQLRQGWDRLIFSGKAGAPIEVSSIQEMKDRVATTPGAIGYITESYVDSSVAVVEVR